MLSPGDPAHAPLAGNDAALGKIERRVAVRAGAPQLSRKFIEARGWKLDVALDARQTAGKQFGADSLPLTVVVGPDGRIAWVKSGYSPAGAKECSAAVMKLLAPQ